MQKIISVECMRHSDAETIRAGVSSKELMYRAGAAIFHAHSWQGKVAIVCGSGNNAGDGYVLALLLQQKQIPCTLVLLSEKFSTDGKHYYDLCRQAGIDEVLYSESFDFSPYTEIVDCILGTGFSGEVTGIYAHAIKNINASHKFVISVDINSGLDGNNGQTSLCVRSDLTLSIGYYQYGHFLSKAKDCMKEKRNLDIGIDLYGPSAFLVEKEELKPLFTKRLQSSHKGTYGYVTIIGGCREYSGAVKLANMSCAALRSGCGVATLAVPESIADSVAPYLLESTLFPLPDKEGHMLADLDMIDRALEHRSAVAIGMGWGKSAENAKILEHILKSHTLPIIIDADGLNTLSAMDTSVFKDTKCKVVLTPHLMEFSRLSGYSIHDIEQDPIVHAMEYAKNNRVILLLKGSCTIVTDGVEVLLVDRGCVGMATAGSGDVLSGILCGLLGFLPYSPLSIACGAYIAGLAGELAEKEINEVSMLASDTVAHIGKAISMIIKQGETR